MRRAYLERKLRIAGFYLKREGASHSLRMNPKTGAIEAIPQHKEIEKPLAKKIVRALNVEWTYIIQDLFLICL